MPGPLKVSAGHIVTLTSARSWHIFGSHVDPLGHGGLCTGHTGPPMVFQTQNIEGLHPFVLKWDNLVDWGCFSCQLYFPCRWHISVFFNPISFFSFGLVTGHILSKGKSSLNLLGCWTTLVGRYKLFDSTNWSVRQCKQGRPPKLAMSNAEQK